MPEVTRNGVRIERAGRAARFALRGGEAMAHAAGAALLLDLPTKVGRAVERAGLAALCLGPDEWLLLGPLEHEHDLRRSLIAALQSLPHSLVNISHRDVGFVLRGSTSADVINAGCALDLRMAIFPAGCATRTLLARAEIVLWRREPHLFCIETARSFAAYVQQFFTLAARDNS